MAGTLQVTANSPLTFMYWKLRHRGNNCLSKAPDTSKQKEFSVLSVFDALVHCFAMAVSSDQNKGLFPSQGL